MSKKFKTAAFFLETIFAAVIFVSALTALGNGSQYLNKEAPNFNLPLTDGTRTSLNSLRLGEKKTRVTVLVFFDTECEPCIKEMPQIEKIYKKYSKEDVVLRLVSIGEDLETVQKFLKDRKIPIPAILDKSTILASQYGVVTGSIKNIPQIFVIGKDGLIKEHLKGYHKDVFSLLSAAIDKSLKQKVSLTPTGEIDIIYTGGASGTIQSCDCPDSPFGGFDRRLKYLKENRRKNTLILNTGDAYSPYPKELKNRYIAELQSMMKYDAVILGDQEMRTGTEFLSEQLTRFPLPVVMANLQICIDEKNCLIIGQPYLIKNIGNVKVALVGLISEDSFFLFPEKITKNLKFTSTPEEYLNDNLDKIKEESDLVVILTHQGETKDKELALKFKGRGIDIIIGGHSQSKVNTKVGDTIIVQPGDKGMYAGQLSLKLDKEKKIKSYKNTLTALTEDMGADSVALALIEKYRKEYRKKLKERVK
ncbi:MAG: redoxin domain-containing protein [Elusimicrobia bacterium]|jgi:peroxiredoxin|nr:redoxin domain-containing protein [Elusimicrobiota bacterium]